MSSLDDVLTTIYRDLSALITCRRCHVVVNRSCLEALPISTCQSLHLSPFDIFMIRCDCFPNNLPFYVCVKCQVSSKQSKSKRLKNSSETWLREHASGEDHCRHHEIDDRSLSGGGDDDDDGGEIFDSPSSSVDSSTGSKNSNQYGLTGMVEEPSVDFSAVTCMNENQRRFHGYEHTAPGLGFAHIIKNAMRTSAPAHEMHMDEVGFHLDVCTLCVQLTRSQLRSVGGMVENIVQYYTSALKRKGESPADVDNLISTMQSNLQLQNLPLLTSEQVLVLRQSYESQKESTEPPTRHGLFKETRPATTYLELDRYYLKSNNSVFKNLPVPEVLMSNDGMHSYVPLPQIVAGFLASGVSNLAVPSTSELADNEVMKSYYTSPRARTVYEECREMAVLKNLENGECFSLHFKDWADDAQKAEKRTQYDSYNIRTITFMKHLGNGDIRYYSYPISLGLKSVDHEEVEQKFNEDLLALSEPNYFYSGHHRKGFWLVASLIAGIRDRPARGETFLIGNHNHTYAKRFGWTAYHGESQAFLPCIICNTTRISRLKKEIFVPKSRNEPYCSLCSDLDYSSPVLKASLSTLYNNTFKYPLYLEEGSPPPPDSRPVRASKDDVIFRPVKLTFAFLKKVSAVGFYNYHTRKHQQFLRSLARTQRERTTVGPVRGWTLGNLKAYVRTAGANEDLCGKIQEFSEENIHTSPDSLMERFSLEVIPAAWKRLGCEVSHQLDAVFHLVYHGVAPDVWDSYIGCVSQIKIGGNLSLKSAIKTIAQPVLKAIHELQLKELPVHPFSKGKTGSDLSYAGWIGINKMAFSFLMPYIASHTRYLYKVLLPTNSPFRVTLPEDQEKMIQRVQLAIFSFVCASTLILQSEITELQCSEMGEYFKLFINEITASQQFYVKEESSLSYLSTGNFLSLLNLEENARMFGPLRNFWDALDEKNVQDIKRYWPHVNLSSPNWQQALLQGVIREKFLGLLWKRKPSTETVLDNIRIMVGDAERFNAVCSLPFSGVYNKTTKCFFVLVRSGQRTGNIFMQQMFVSEEWQTVGSCQYYLYEISDKKSLCPKEQVAELLQDHIAVLFLPFQYHRNDKKLEKRQAKITILSVVDRMVYNDGKFILPSLSPGGIEGNVDLRPDVDDEPDTEGMMIV